MNQYSKYILLKSAMEDVFGSDAWYSLKESNHIPTWRKYAVKMLKTILFTIKDSVEIYDNDWMAQIEETIQRGIEDLKDIKAIDEIIGVLAGTLIQVSFLQIGQIPRKAGKPAKNSLRKGKWKLNSYRTVVYLQTNEQKENLFIDKQIKIIGFDEQQGLRGKYYRSKSKLPYSEWCKESEKA